MNRVAGRVQPTNLIYPIVNSSDTSTITGGSAKAPKRIAILGSTGSIGTQTLDVIAEYPDRFRPTLLVAGRKVDTLIQQALKWRPQMAIIADESLYWKLRDALAPVSYTHLTLPTKRIV